MNIPMTILRVLKNLYLTQRQLMMRRRQARIARNHIVVPRILSELDKSNMCYLGATTMVRREDRFLHEWIEFHSGQGVDHFYIYDNGNSPETLERVRSFIQEGKVTYIAWPNIAPEFARSGFRKGHSQESKRARVSMQTLAFDHFLRNHMQRFKWIMHFDVDEYIYPASREFDSIRSVLETYDGRRVCSVKVFGHNFGSSGFQTPPDLNVTEAYRYRERDPTHFKSIGNTDYVVSSFNPHFFAYPLHIRVLEAAGYFKTVETDLLRMNHYKLKSRQDFMDKRILVGEGWSLEDFERLDAAFSEVEDDGLVLRYAVEEET